MDTNLYWQIRGTYAERKSALKASDRDWLEAAILDGEYNDFLRAHADYKEKDVDKHGHGKRLPYIGWFWRHLCFSEGKLPLGDCGDFVGFMPNNKWDYRERDTTPDEFAEIMAIIDEAMRLNQQGGDLSKIIAETHVKLDELWDYVTTLSISLEQVQP